MAQNFRPLRRAYAASASGVDVHADRPLSNIAIRAFRNGDEGLIGNDVMPAVPVGNQSNTYWRIEKDAYRRTPPTARSPGEKANRISFSVSSDQYFAKNFALASEIPLEDLANGDTAVGVRGNHTTLITTDLLLDQEVRIANLVTSISNVGSGVQLTGAAKWTDEVNSDPISDVNTAAAFMRQQTGLLPNTAIMDWDTFQIARRHPGLLDYFKRVDGGELTEQQVATLFHVGRLLIGQGVVQNELPVRDGATLTMSVTNVWGNNVVLAHIQPGRGTQTRTAALRFQWQPSNFPTPFAVQRSVINQAGSEHVEVQEAMYFQAEKIIAPDLMYVIQNPR